MGDRPQINRGIGTVRTGRRAFGRQVVGSIVRSLHIEGQSLGNHIEVLGKRKIEVQFILGRFAVTPVVVAVQPAREFRKWDVVVLVIVDVLPVDETRTCERRTPHDILPERIGQRFSFVAHAPADIDFQLSRIRNVYVDVRAVVEALIIVIRVITLVETLHHTVLVEVTQRHEIADAVTAARQGRVVLCLPGDVLEDVFAPVHIREHDRIGLRAEHFRYERRKGELVILNAGIVGALGLGIERSVSITVDTGQVSQRLSQSEGRIPRNLWLALRTAPCRDQDDAIGAANPEYGRRRCILEDGHTLDLVRVHLEKRTLDTVHQDKRLRRLVRKRSRTADINIGVFGTGLSGNLYRRNACHGPRKGTAGTAAR